MIETANKIPVPLPIAPIKSENMLINPMIMPPNAAAVGMYLFRVGRISDYCLPAIIMPSSFNFFATSFGDSFDIYSQNLYNLGITWKRMRNSTS